MSNKKRLIQIISGLVVVALIIVVIVAVSGGKNKPSAAAPNTGKASGTITFAEGATANPNWIFPFESCQYCSVDNINQFQDEMFRPMYWFGVGGSVALTPSLSLAYNPVYSNHDKTVSMYKAVPAECWGYSPGYGSRDQVSSVTQKGMTVTIDFKTNVNPLCITNN